MTKSRIFLWLLISFIGGVFARSFFEIGNVFILLLIIFSIIILTIFYKKPLAAVAAFMLLGFALGILQTENLLQKASDLDLIGKHWEGKVVVIKNSDSQYGQNLIVESKENKNENIRMLVQIPKYSEVAYGDVLQINCELKAIENQNTEFDYKMYMAKDGVYYKCENEKYEKIGNDGGNYILRKIISSKGVFEEKIKTVIPYPESVLAGGILFGGSEGLSEEIKNDFSRTGMTHIVAVSGYNVTIIAEYLILLGLAFGLWRKQAIWFALFGIVIFVAMIGMPASAVRAGVMSSILLWAIKNGRLASSENAIILAGAIMLFINPLLLRYDIGFQLSFLATLGIVLTSPFWEKSFIKKHKTFGISEMIALSLSAQIFVLPIIAYNFHMTSLISLLANVLILPIVPLSMLLVFLTALVALIFAPLSMIFAWLSYVALHYEIIIIKTLSQISWASVEVNNFSVSFVLIYYIILTVALVWLNKFKTRCKVTEK